MSQDIARINIDGGARGNPGPASFAYSIARDGQPAVEEAQCLGRTTNNVAEYTALVRALERAGQLGLKKLHIRSDSELLVKQMNGEYKVKNADLRTLFERAQQLSRQFQQVTITHVFREQNSRADFLCNEALDGRPVSPLIEASRPAPAAPAAAPRPPAAPVKTLRQEAIACLREAAEAWSDGDLDEPTPEEVWNQLEALIKKHQQAK
ncbi:MAG: ribonuclease HI family protein [Planctomycetia bacterium]|nr:ribonuclease HI family protein [Planctomycetia bacterium]